MYTRKLFRTKDMFKWTRYESLLFLIFSTLAVGCYEYFELHWLQIPWTPLALVGTAMAFVIGFQNNAAYGRIWEARTIWGGIVNTSRTFGVFVKDMVTNEHCKQEVSEDEIKNEVKTLTYRHIAWLTALRHAMRASKPWEVVTLEKTNAEWARMILPPERRTALEDDLKPYLSDKEMDYVLSKSNKQTAILNLQSTHLRELKEKGLIWDFSFLEIENVLKDLFTLQGQSERIKNFPYPRHFASMSYYLVRLFIVLLPFGIVPQFNEIGKDLVKDGFEHFGAYFIWFSIPFSLVVMWVFSTIERIGRTGENPFEGTANDVPISTIARGIEIDLRENLGEKKEDIPSQFPEIYDTQM